MSDTTSHHSLYGKSRNSRDPKGASQSGMANSMSYDFQWSLSCSFVGIRYGSQRFHKVCLILAVGIAKLINK